MLSDTEVNDAQNPPRRRPGRPPIYVFSKPDAELSENERRLKDSVLKRRQRQNRSYHRKKRQRLEQDNEPIHEEEEEEDHDHEHDPVEKLEALLNQPSCLTSRFNHSLLHVPPSSEHVTEALNPLLQLPLSRKPSLSTVENVAAPSPLRPVSTSDILSCGSLISPRKCGAASLSSFSSLPPDPLSPAAPSLSSEPDEDQLVHNVLDITAESCAASPSTSSLIQYPSNLTLLNGDLQHRLSTIPHASVATLEKLAVFPSSFSAASAAFVTEHSSAHLSSFAANVLNPLVSAGLIDRLATGRFRVNPAPRAMLPPVNGTDSQAMRQFVKYFTNCLEKMDPSSLSKDGAARLEAMRLYDAERDNMRVAVDLSRSIGDKRLSFNFLQHSASIMRYSTAPEERVEVFTNALGEAGLLTGKNYDGQVDEDVENIEGEARIRLALGEAYFDMLSFEEAAKHVSVAVRMFTKTAAGSGNKLSSFSVSSSILALLLLAEYRISESKFAEASGLLAQALNVLREVGLRESTFAVCCLLSLASVYASMDNGESAMKTVETALSVLKGLRFDDMPLFADGLRTLGTVHLKQGNASMAEAIFFAALRVIEGWMSRSDWKETPYQHCTHLDIFVVELIAEAFDVQGKTSEAQQYRERARRQRIERNLKNEDEASRSTNVSPVSTSSYSSRRLLTRHLY